MGKRIVLVLSLLWVAGFMIPFEGVQAVDKYPVKPIIFLVPNEAGSSADTAARLLAGRLQAQLGSLSW